MRTLTIKNIDNKVLVVGPIYNKINKLDNIKEIEENYNLIIFNGNLLYPSENIEEISLRINLFEKYAKANYIYNLGNYDLELLLNSKISLDIKNWILSKSNVIMIEFKNQTKLIVLGGGVYPQMTKNDLIDNIEVSFISKINNKPWHHFYGGGYGYIISNLPLTDKIPSFYNYSAQIGNFYQENTNTYAQEADQYGLKETILL